MRWFLPTLFALAAGCNPAAAPVHPVEGAVTVGGKPAAGAVLTFYRTDPGPGPAAFPFAVSGPDGSFRATTHKQNDGAPEGTYAVTVVWPRPAAKSARDSDEDGRDPVDQLAGRYADKAKTPLRATVARGGARLDPFRLD